MVLLLVSESSGPPSISACKSLASHVPTGPPYPHNKIGDRNQRDWCRSFWWADLLLGAFCEGAKQSYKQAARSTINQITSLSLSASGHHV
jgi:hypothetical protein